MQTMKRDLMSERDKLYMLAIGWINLKSINSVIEARHKHVCSVWLYFQETVEGINLTPSDQT
jgi:hypothetical protein